MKNGERKNAEMLIERVGEKEKETISTISHMKCTKKDFENEYLLLLFKKKLRYIKTNYFVVPQSLISEIKRYIS